MPKWSELDQGNWNPMRAKHSPEKVTVDAGSTTHSIPITRDQAASAIHKITGGAPIKHTLYIPDGMVPWIEVVGDKVTVEMRLRENVHPSVQHWNGDPSLIKSNSMQDCYVTSSDMEAYWDSVAEWVDAQAASMPTATD